MKNEDLPLRIAAIDFGERRIGIAITDPLKILAQPLTTIKNDNNLIPTLKKLFSEKPVEKIILGFPLRETGEKSHITDSVLHFKLMLEKEFEVPVHLIDERYTSSMAQQRIIEIVPKKSKRRDKGLIDMNAAVILLEDYLRQENRQ